jgi:hypothetical protein
LLFEEFVPSVLTFAPRRFEYSLEAFAVIHFFRNSTSGTGCLGFRTLIRAQHCRRGLFNHRACTKFCARFDLAHAAEKRITAEAGFSGQRSRIENSAVMAQLPVGGFVILRRNLFEI